MGTQYSTNGQGDPSVYPNKVTPGLYDRFRTLNGPTLYGPDQRTVTADLLEAGWIYATCILAFSLLILLPGLRIITGTSALIRILVGVGVLGMIMISNFGQDWEVAYIDKTTTAYRAGIPYEINASIGVHIGLRSVNVTLLGIPRIQTFENGLINETIDYNERFHWDNHGFVQGTAGFGPRAGLFNRMFREHQRRGSPYPILWVAEYFTPDGEGIRWGRFYRNAGYFTHIMVWTALPLWILALILFKMVIRYGAYCSLMTGVSLFIANIIFATLRNSNQLEIPFPDKNLIFAWGWSFWMCMSMGLICCVIGIVVIIMDLFFHEITSEFFNVDVTQDMEEFYPDEEEIEAASAGRGKKSYRTRTVMMTTNKSSAGNGREELSMPLTPPASSADLNEIELREGNGAKVPQPGIQRGYRKRTILGPMQKSRKSQPRPAPPSNYQDLHRDQDDHSQSGRDNYGMEQDGGEYENA